MASTVDSKRVREYDEEQTPEFATKLDRLAKLVRRSKYTVFYTGAGVSTSAGVGDYRGPSGAWTNRKIKELERKGNSRTKEENEELERLKKEAAREVQKAKKKVSMNDAQPTPTHMAMATLIRLGIAHYVVTTNLDGIHRKSGLKGHEQLCNLHGDIYVERCTGCGYDFERNYHVRQDFLHVHDHKFGTCERCGSAPPAHYKGTPGNLEMKKSKWGGRMVGTRDVNCGTKDTHINFGEFLDEVDWNDAERHCSKADLCIIAGTSMSLRHITHFPFMAKKVVLINLQATPDDKKANLRIWAKCDPVFEGLMQRLNIPIDPIPVWRPRDSVPIDKIPKMVHSYYVEKAKDLEEMAKFREAEAEDRRREQEAERMAAAMSLKDDDDEEGEEGAGKGKDKKKKKRKGKGKGKGKEDAREGGADEKKDGSAAPSGLPKELVIGNAHEIVKESNHRWTMFLRLPDSAESAGKRIEDYVDSVEYKLHPTFDPAVVLVESAPFEISRTGWGTFSVGVTVNWKKNVCEQSTRLTHQLDFSQDRTARILALSWSNQSPDYL